jgi:hypothetical protein
VIFHFLPVNPLPILVAMSVDFKNKGLFWGVLGKPGVRDASGTGTVWRGHEMNDGIDG